MFITYLKNTISSSDCHEILIFEHMQLANESGILVETATIVSAMLARDVKVDFYIPRSVTDPSQMSLLLINDGQDLKTMNFEVMLDTLYAEGSITPLFCVGIHCGPERRREYGVAGIPDYKGRGDKADLYTAFIFEELMPYIRKTYTILSFREKAFAGFSMGGLTALDIVLNHSIEFTKAGVFSGSLWWRSEDQESEIYDDGKHRIIHQLVRNTSHYPWLKFFFQCGNMDEIKDRNNNGIIDSIDDTLDLIKELEEKGYSKSDIEYLEMSDGKHDVPTWGKAMPVFLKWGWGI